MAGSQTLLSSLGLLRNPHSDLNLTASVCSSIKWEWGWFSHNAWGSNANLIYWALCLTNRKSEPSSIRYVTFYICLHEIKSWFNVYMPKLTVSPKSVISVLQYMERSSSVSSFKKYLSRGMVCSFCGPLCHGSCVVQCPALPRLQEAMAQPQPWESTGVHSHLCSSHHQSSY